MREFVRCVAFISLILLPVAACSEESPSERAQGYLESAVEKRDAGKLDAAVIELKNALQIAPDHARARRALGEIYLATWQGEAAVKELKRARKAGADDPAVLIQLARAHLMAGEPAEVLELIPAVETVSGDTQAERQVLRARALAATGETAAAEMLFESVLSETELSDARLGLAQILASRGDHAAALEHVAKAIEIAPGDGRARLLKARILTAQDKYVPAMRVLERARADGAGGAQVDLLLVATALQLRDFETAWSVAEELEASHADVPMVQYYAALRDLSEDRLEDARRGAEGLVGRYPGFAQAELVAGAANFGLENYQQAQQRLRRYLNGNPENLGARVLLARTWIELGDAANAREVMQAAPENGSAAARNYLSALIRQRAREAGGVVETGATEASGQPLPERQYAAAKDTIGSDAPLTEEVDPLDQGVAQDLRERAQAIIAAARAENFEKAIAAVTALKADYPDHGLPPFLHGLVLLAQEKPAAAVGELETAHERSPANVAVTLYLARAHRANGAESDALEVLESALAKRPGSEPLALAAARLYAGRGERDAMERVLKAAIEETPDALRARVYLARLYLVEGKAGEAQAIAEPGLESHPQSAPLLEVVGRARQAGGDHARAAEAFTKLVNLAPDRAEAHYLAGESLLAAGSAEEALGYLEKARQLAPDSLRPGLLLAKAYLDAGELAAAGELIAELETAYPKESEVAILRARHALVGDKDPKAAVAAYERALALEPSEDRAIKLARLQIRLGMPEAATETLSEWAEAHTASVKSRQALGELNLALERYTEAARVYRELINMDPESVAYHNNLAWALHKAGDNREALVHANAAHDRAPEDPDVLDTRGVVLMALDRTEEAVAALGEAVTEDKSRPDIRLHYAEALLAAGRRDEARAQLEQVDAERLSEKLGERLQILKTELEG